jgi:maleate cis-trans isomerase/quercetin dioxygenase-like cupin family protein
MKGEHKPVQGFSLVNPPSVGTTKESLRVGVLIPSSDTGIERELRAFLPESVSPHFTRMPLKSVTEGELESMGVQFRDAAALIADISPDLVVYGCTSGTFFGGLHYDRRLREELQAITCCPVITIASAVTELLAQTSISRLAVYAPYNRRLCERMVTFFDEHDLGIQVEDVFYMNIVDDLQTGRITEDQAKHFVLDNPSLAADGVFVSCGNLRILRQLRKLWLDIKKPVFSSNLAVIWSICRHFGIAPGSDLFQCIDGRPNADQWEPAFPQGVVVRSLDNIVGSVRDVSWGNGQSRRFLIQRDAVPFSVTDTIVWAGTTSRLKYENHVEACYCIEGTGQFIVDGKRVRLKPGDLYLVNHHEHYLHAETQMRFVCVFNPALKGGESHTLSGDSYSTY